MFLDNSNIFYNMSDYIKFYEKVATKRVQLSKYISENCKPDATIGLFGYCDYCKLPTRFVVDWKDSGGANIINFRERTHCEHCGFNSRHRFMLSTIRDYVKSNNFKDIYIYEQVTPFFDILKGLLPDSNIYGSEYLGYDKLKGVEYSGIRHEDALSLSFADNTMDFVISQDVLEHVPDYTKALEETFRILKSGGIFLFTVPFNTTTFNSVQRSELGFDGCIKYILPPVYHGNPVDKNGSLVFFDYGWDLLETIGRVGFINSGLISYYDYLLGYMGGADQFVFVAYKP